ncbi:hypothetical protein M514_01501 [Trichuris suis]|uniref:Uncharacterized protein n=1 Tax=Trichuris suis TaxID=68888 RepID=A0A085NIB3_9BILA|nr:hypothetical protein M513_01501 [Trichuris suis]KFD69209.1 hypothetical protein M514_01501 [Trichuris suis]
MHYVVSLRKRYSTRKPFRSRLLNSNGLDHWTVNLPVTLEVTEGTTDHSSASFFDVRTRSRPWSHAIAHILWPNFDRIRGTRKKIVYGHLRVFDEVSVNVEQCPFINTFEHILVLAYGTTFRRIPDEGNQQQGECIVGRKCSTSKSPMGPKNFVLHLLSNATSIHVTT